MPLDTPTTCEFHFPDEERFYPLKYHSCPVCGGMAQLHCARILHVVRYQVECDDKRCDHKTGWRKSSAEATRIWKVTAILHNV